MNPIDRRIRDNNIMLAMFLGLKPDDDQDRPHKPWWFYTGCSYMIFADEKDLGFNTSLDRLALVYNRIKEFVMAVESVHERDGKATGRAQEMARAAMTLDIETMYTKAVSKLQWALDEFYVLEDEDQDAIKHFLPPMFMSELEKWDEYSGKNVGDIYIDVDTKMAWHLVEPNDKYALKLK